MDIIAGIIELFASYKVGEKERKCFILHFIANGIWVFVAIKTGIYGLLLCVIPAMVLNVINYKKWEGR